MFTRSSTAWPGFERAFKIRKIKIFYYVRCRLQFRASLNMTGKRDKPMPVAIKGALAAAAIAAEKATAALASCK
jgi:hypothetical protein